MLHKLSVLRLALLTYVGLLSVYALFSYSLVHPNLVLTAWPPYWTFQTWMWHTFFNDRVLLTQTYTLLLGLLFGNFLVIIRSLKPVALTRRHIVIFCLIIAPLFISFNALSSDVFNYIFNARMVLVYHTNPHLVSALNFPHDPMVRFMMNIEGLAPYGYGWTAISLLPSLLGMQKFVPTWLIFRAFSVLGLLFLGASYWWWSRQKIVGAVT